jgi:hypothetical protein
MSERRRANLQVLQGFGWRQLSGNVCYKSRRSPQGFLKKPVLTELL